MYLRTTRRKNRDGSEVVYYQLAHNSRDPVTGKVSASIIHNFGRADSLDRDVLVRLCRSIARICGLEVVEPLAAREAEAPVEMLGATNLGGPTLARALWERLGIGPAIRGQLEGAGASTQLETALFAMIANRLDDPTSKLGVYKRWRDTVFLPEADELALDRFYEALDFLHDHHADIEQAVFFHVANLLNLEVDLIFYDTTTAEFALDEPDPDGLRRLGYSKEDRWTPQVVIALAVTREGLPVRSWVFPGNTSDVTTIQKVREDLRGWRLGRTLFVGDAGMNSEENRKILTRGAGRYVLACGASSSNEVVQDVLGRAGRYKEIAENLQVKEVVVGEGELRRRYLVCRNPAQAEREAKHREQVIEELEAELAKHKDASTDRAWVAKLRASKRFSKYLTVKNSRIRIDRAKIKAAEKRDGKWVLITNDDTLSPSDAAQAYKALLTIERCFRTMKSVQIEVRPMFHRLDRRIVAHVKLCVLALLMTRAAELEAECSWAEIRHQVSRLQAIEYRTDTHRFIQRSTPSASLRKLLSTLQVELPKVILDARPREEQLSLA